MNKVILCGRLVRDVELRHSGQMAIARYTIAVDRKFKKEGEPTSDFINCIEFGKQAEFAEKYFRKGIKLIVSGRIQTGSYTNKDGQRVYTTDVVVEDHEFAESKNNSSALAESSGNSISEKPTAPVESKNEDFMSIPDSIEEDFPFS